MIISYKEKWIVFTAVKVGSTMLHTILGFPPFSGEVKGYYEGVHDFPDKHELQAPAGTEDYRRIIAVRNPYRRAISLWLHQAVRNPGTAYAKSFLTFCETKLLEAPPDLYGNASLSQSYAHLLDAEPIRLECHAADIDRILLNREPFVPIYSNVTHTDTQWQHHYRFNRGAREIVANWAAEDFERWGYRP